ncbi:hypothetical protein BDN72DRAFT_183056 [Pluteus cervinus]|uniref:Uncharacterized protein n=1 Tax=Pluteus cervinus TaxID=181527 RepID=A0ACD3B713_9AGAR|nr:hypothetical protein BDN72DRAFT_183056 [Pluteus cervinus]
MTLVVVEFLRLLGVLRRWFWARLRKIKTLRLSAFLSSIIRHLLRQLGFHRDLKKRDPPWEGMTGKHRDIITNNPEATQAGGLKLSLDNGESFRIVPSAIPLSRLDKADIDIEAQNLSPEPLKPQFTEEPADSEGLTPSATALADADADAPSDPLHMETLHGLEGGEGQIPQASKPEETRPTLKNDRIKPCVPELYRRYERNVIVPRKSKRITIPAGTGTFTTYSDPEGWKSYIHPEGARYFFHEEKRVFTDAWLFDPEFLNQVHQDMDIIFTFMEKNHMVGHPEVDLVLDMIPRASNRKPANMDCFYYFANHRNRTIFFLDDFHANEIPAWNNLMGTSTLSHLRHEIESQYWYHHVLFPQPLPMHDEIVGELQDTILHAISDVMTSATSTSPYGLTELQNISSYVGRLRQNVDGRSSVSTTVIGRLMHVFERQKFNNFHGEPGARLDRDHSVYESDRRAQSWLIEFCSPLLFYGPSVHLRDLDSVWFDGLMYHAAWTRLMKKLIDDWQDYILFATVLLNANVAFLAIQSVDTHTDPKFRSPAQIASYLSIIASIGCVILGLLLVAQCRMNGQEVVYDAHAFLVRKDDPFLGLERLAILYSSPYALLIWAMVSFLLAFALLWFSDSSHTTQIFVGIAGLAVSTLIVWCIWMMWHVRVKGRR